MASPASPASPAWSDDDTYVLSSTWTDDTTAKHARVFATRKDVPRSAAPPPDRKQPEPTECGLPPIKQGPQLPPELHINEFNVLTDRRRRDREVESRFICFPEEDAKVTDRRGNVLMPRTLSPNSMGTYDLSREYLHRPIVRDDPLRAVMNFEVRRLLGDPAISEIERAVHRAMVSGRYHNPGRVMAENIDWTRKLYDGSRMDESERQEFIEYIDSGLQLSHCSKCGLNHIPWGPPVTLEDRDTCYSMLPKWFPAHLFERPWDAWRALLNRMIENHEYERDGLQAPRCELNFHEPSSKWSVIGKVGGWWKCRADGFDVPDVERNCYICHGPHDGLKTEYGEKNTVEAWIERCMGAITLEDREIVNQHRGVDLIAEVRALAAAYPGDEVAVESESEAET